MDSVPLFFFLLGLLYLCLTSEGNWSTSRSFSFCVFLCTWTSLSSKCKVIIYCLCSCNARLLIREDWTVCTTALTFWFIWQTSRPTALCYMTAKVLQSSYYQRTGERNLGTVSDPLSGVLESQQCSNWMKLSPINDTFNFELSLV